jgi:hypothetical protein
MQTTTDFSDFGRQERKEMIKILLAWDEDGLPSDFYDDKVTFMFNQDSGNVFLVNSEYQVAMRNGDKLESFYVCPQCGHECFLEDIEHCGTSDCAAWIKDIKNIER